MMTEQTRHVPLDHMIDLALGTLPNTEHEAIRGHIAGCASCITQLARLERLLALAAADTSEEVPSHIAARAVRLMRQRRAAAPPRRHLVALLHFDSTRAPMALGRRGGTRAARQLMFTAGQHDVDLRIKASGNDWVVWGQLLGPVDGGQVELAGPMKVQAELTPQGEFSLPPVPQGAYTLQLVLREISIGMALEIGY